MNTLTNEQKAIQLVQVLVTHRLQRSDDADKLLATSSKMREIINDCIQSAKQAILPFDETFVRVAIKHTFKQLLNPRID